MSKPAPTQLSFFQAIFANMKELPDVDWDAVATQAGYNSGGTARTRFGQIRRELLKRGGETITTTAVKAPAKPRVKKSSVKAAAGSGMHSTASKVTKARSVRGGKKAAVGGKMEKGEEMKDDGDQDDDDDEENEIGDDASDEMNV